MGIVGRKEKQLWARLLGHPTDVFERKRCEANLSTNEIRGQHAQLLQPRLGFAKGSERRVEVVQQSRHPARAEFDNAAAKRRELIEDAVENHGAQEVGRGVMQRREIFAAQVLPASEPVRHPRIAVLVIGGRQQMAAADVEHERHPRLGEHGPKGFEVAMGW